MNKVLSVFFFIIGAFLFYAVISLDIVGVKGVTLILLSMAILVTSAILFNTEEEEKSESI